MQLRLFDPGSSHDPTFITRVALRNYRSIASCDVKLGALTILVGENGAGKSNFLDALRLISDALTTSLDHALRERGGLGEVRRRSGGHPTHFTVRVDFRLGAEADGFFAFEIGARSRGTYTVQREKCRVGDAAYSVVDGKVVHTTAPVPPPAAADRLYLVNAAGLPEFRPLFDAFARMGFYNIDPAQIRALHGPDKGELLARNGKNLASVAARMESTSPTTKLRIEEYLGQVVPGVLGFDRRSVGHMETLEFRQVVDGASTAWRFPAINMSDGTLRASAILTALYQNDPAAPIRLIGLEEPETALHPAAAGILRDCILEATRSVQVIVTSHSADLLDDEALPAESLRAVESVRGTTLIGALDEATRGALRDRLYTAGELLRMRQLTPEEGVPAPRARQLDLFAEAL